MIKTIYAERCKVKGINLGAIVMIGFAPQRLAAAWFGVAGAGLYNPEPEWPGAVIHTECRDGYERVTVRNRVLPSRVLR